MGMASGVGALCRVSMFREREYDNVQGATLFVKRVHC